MVDLQRVEADRVGRERPERVDFQPPPEGCSEPTRVRGRLAVEAGVREPDVICLVRRRCLAGFRGGSAIVERPLKNADMNAAPHPNPDDLLVLLAVARTGRY